MLHGEKKMRNWREQLDELLGIGRKLKIKPEREEFWILLMVMIYTIVFSCFTISRMYALSASAWDLGNYNQAIYTTIFNGKLFYYTPDLPANPTGSLFGVHFSPSLVVLFPFYAIYPASETLLVLQSFVLSLGSFPTYWLTRDILGSKKWGLVFALTYLLNSALWGINWFDFHPEALIPLSLLLVIHSFQKRSWCKLAVFATFSLGIMEQVPILMMVLSLYFVYESKDFFSGNKRNSQNKNSMFSSLLLLFVSCIWLLISTSIIHSLSPESPLHFGKVTSWEILGAPNFLQIPSAIIRNPIAALNALSNDWTSKVLYLASLYGSFGFLGLFSPTALILAVPWLAVALLSNNIVYYNLGVQYPAFILPFVVFASIKGAKNLKRLEIGMRFRGVSRIKSIVKPRKEYLIFFAFAFLVLSNPIAGLDVVTFPHTAYGVPSISSHGESAMRIVELIPKEASVLVPQRIFPLVSSRLNAFTPPTSAFMPPGNSFLSKLESLIDLSEYIVLDWVDVGAMEPVILSLIGNKYGCVASSNGIILLKRGYIGGLKLFEPYEQVFDYQDLIIRTGITTRDATSNSDFVIQRDDSNSSENDMWWGPFPMLPPGRYLVTYRIKANKTVDENLILLPVSLFELRVDMEIYGSISDGYLTLFSFSASEKHFLKQIALNGKSVKANEYIDISMNFTADYLGTYEFPGLNSIGNFSLTLDEIRVQQIEPLSYIKPIYVQFGNFSQTYLDSQLTSNIFALMDLIPKQASLLIQNDLSPLYSDLNDAYVLPPQNNSAAEILSYLKSNSNDVEFILVN